MVKLLYSKQFLEDLLGTSITTIAYPRGSYDAEIIQTATEVGYSVGFTVKPGMSKRKNPPFVIPRIPVFSYTSDVITAIKQIPDYAVESGKTP